LAIAPPVFLKAVAGLVGEFFYQRFGRVGGELGGGSRELGGSPLGRRTVGARRIGSVFVRGGSLIGPGGVATNGSGMLLGAPTLLLFMLLAFLDRLSHLHRRKPNTFRCTCHRAYKRTSTSRDRFSRSVKIVPIVVAYES